MTKIKYEKYVLEDRRNKLKWIQIIAKIKTSRLQLKAAIHKTETRTLKNGHTP